jgi:CRISPR-associated endonuclease Cas2
MSIISVILDEMLTREFHYKGVKVNIFGIPILANTSKSSFDTAIHRAKKLGYIDGAKEEYYLTEKGKMYAKKIKDRLVIFEPPVKISKKKDLLLMFDIPENRKGEREWFRYHLRIFGFEMVQRSVWVGPSNLPKEFLEYIKERKLNKCVLVFKLAEGFLDMNKHILK